jgi:proteasome lid subunit RPN8/RPN11
MALILSRKQHGQLLDWANEAGNVECCGLLLGQGEVVSDVALADNVALDPSRHFEIDPAMLIAAEKHARQGGPSIIGYFHSHPNGLARPSEQDAASAADDRRIWLIVADGSVSGWLATRDRDGGIAFQPVDLLVEG